MHCIRYLCMDTHHHRIKVPHQPPLAPTMDVDSPPYWSFEPCTSPMQLPHAISSGTSFVQMPSDGVTQLHCVLHGSTPSGQTDRHGFQSLGFGSSSVHSFIQSTCACRGKGALPTYYSHAQAHGDHRSAPLHQRPSQAVSRALAGRCWSAALPHMHVTAAPLLSPAAVYGSRVWQRRRCVPATPLHHPVARMYHLDQCNVLSICTS